MSNNFKQILDKLESEHKVFEQIVFDQHKNTLKFLLKKGSQINEETIQILVEDIKKALPFIDNISFSMPNMQYSKPKVPLDLWEDIVRRITKGMPVLQQMLLESKRRGNRQEIILTLDSQISLDLVRNKKLDIMIKNAYDEQFDSTIDIVWHINDEDSLEEFNTDQESKAHEMVKEATKQSVIKESKQSSGNKDDTIVYKRLTKGNVEKIREIVEEETTALIHATVFAKENRELKGGKILFTLSVTDYTDSIGIKMFLNKKDFQSIDDKININQYYAFEGNIRYDTFGNELILFPNAINQLDIKEVIRKDQSTEKRVELHLHTNMSEMDGTTPAKALISRAKEWGHKAIAITDHGVIQAFPEAMDAAKDNEIKVIYGMEGYLFDDTSKIIEKVNDLDFNQEFVIFDIETTGFSYTMDHIIEIGAVKIKNKEIIETFSVLINPEVSLPSEIIELTGITDDDLKGKNTIDKELPSFLDFIGDLPVVAHNAVFDTSFIIFNCKKNNLKFDNIIIDTLKLSRILLTNLKRHRLSSLVKYYGITLENHHRAVDDAIATAKIFIFQLQELENREVFTLSQINQIEIDKKDMSSREFFHFTVLAKTQSGLKNLYRLVSESHLRYYYKKPRLSKSLINEFRDGLIIGSACDSGEIYQGFVRGLQPEEMIETAEFYDYLEIQPIANSYHLIKNGKFKSEEQLKDIVFKIIELGKLTNKPVVATGDVHFLEPDDAIYRKILMAGQKYRDTDQPPLHFKTTDELLDDFSFLDADLRNKVVISNTNYIADMIDESILPIPKGTFPPKIEGSDDDLRDMCFKKARKIYGEDLPEIVEKRLQRELNSIISNGYAVMYIIAQKLVAKSLEDGYLVGSRGSVGSSFAATMSDITEVNPLPPHYVCKKCHYSEFITSDSIGSGADLPDKKCPKCASDLKKDGHDIPFEVFLGFEGDKEPDIDLNFAGVYQANSHKYTEVLFGKGYVYKAGTIGTIADKTAYGYVKNYFEDNNIKVSQREINRLIKGCTGIRKTTGQHPGGIMVVPNYKDIHDFTPIQYPANDSSSGVITTHFDYHSISGRILKLDILGHDVPTIIRQLEEITHLDIQDVALDDRETISIFTSTKALKILDENYKETIGSLGIPEFGTKFVRQMLKDTQPTTFAELVRISGLSHGTDVWINNAQELVRTNTAQLKDVISTRDDIMNYLIQNNLPHKDAFNIMERVRKGKGITQDQDNLMVKHKIPKWYIDSCNKIKYMFPKAHAVAYVMMSFRIAYFKVHQPLAFYATYFSSKVADFDAELVSQGKNFVLMKMNEINASEQTSKKDQDMAVVLEVVYEMYARGFEFLKVDLYESHYNEFRVIDGKILPPLQALGGVGETVARNIFNERQNEVFISKEDLRVRTKSSKTVIEALEIHGCLKKLPDTNQLQFMDLHNF
ncbi:MAG: PolC-type DNA polymerase III [Clostridiales bacterium]|nr:PolC-type DNA polymerase III [Clostridiales bacterium]